MVYTFKTDLPNVKSRSELKNSIKEKLKEKIIADYNKLKNSDIGKIFLSCVPLDEEYFIQLDGRVLAKALYQDLYRVYKDNFLQDQNENDIIIDTDTQFVIPNCYDRAMIMYDKSGSLDKSDRRFGGNLPWRFNIDKLLDFDLTNQMQLIKNVTNKSEESNNVSNVFSLVEPGKDAYVMKKTNKYTIESTEYSLGDIRFDSKLYFNSRRVYFYTRYKF